MKLKMRTVTELNRHISLLIQSDITLQNLLVKGEVSNLSGREGSHLYFNLIDGETQISCVVFRSAANALRDKIKEGKSLIVSGNIQVYAKQGRYQINVKSVAEDEASYLNKLFLELKAKLERLGYFDPKRKLPVPKKIKKIGLICSKTSAAIIDFLTVLKARSPLLEIFLIDVHVQGDKTALEVSSAIKMLQNIEDLDLIVITRGGGSAEDLFVFNDEEICRTAFESTTPILSAIGHERDTCLLDLCADIVAGTPSIAAQMISEGFFKSISKIPDMVVEIQRRIDERLVFEQMKLDSKSSSLFSMSEHIFFSKRREIDDTLKRVYSESENRLKNERSGLENKLKLLKSYDIKNILERGFSIVWHDGMVLSDLSQLNRGDTIKIQGYDASIVAEVREVQNDG